MKTGGRARRDALVALCPPADVIVDVGADHGYVAEAVGAIASERAPHLVRPRAGLRWVVADGLRPFRRVDVAIVAGMGALTIARILSEGARPAIAVLHAQDDPPRLRRWLAANGWRICRESLAPEAGRFAELVQAAPGVETATGLELDFGPRLLTDGHPLLADHLEQLAGHYRRIAEATHDRAPEVSADARVREAFLRERKSRL